jgi:hypothetical protein
MSSDTRQDRLGAIWNHMIDKINEEANGEYDGRLICFSADRVRWMCEQHYDAGLADGRWPRNAAVSCLIHIRDIIQRGCVIGDFEAGRPLRDALLKDIAEALGETPPGPALPDEAAVRCLEYIRDRVQKNEWVVHLSADPTHPLNTTSIGNTIILGKIAEALGETPPEPPVRTLRELREAAPGAPTAERAAIGCLLNIRKMVRREEQFVRDAMQATHDAILEAVAVTLGESETDISLAIKASREQRENSGG